LTSVDTGTDTLSEGTVRGGVPLADPDVERRAQAVGPLRALPARCDGAVSGV